MTPIITVKAFKCNKCQHIWLSKKYMEDGKTKPIACSKCKSPYWDREVTTVSPTRIKKENKNKK